MTADAPRTTGFPTAPPAPELIEGAFALETAYAPALHDGLNLADLAHVLDLRRREIIPPEAAEELLGVLLDIDRIPAADFPYDPHDGEPYNSREKVLVERVGDTAGWLHAGRPRREATRIAFRLHLRHRLARLVADVGELAWGLARQADLTAGLLFPDQTYLQQAQPSTVGHYLLSFAYPLLRDGQRLSAALDWVNRSPGGAGCVNGTSLRSDREALADLLGFDAVITNTRDAMWQTDGLIEMLSSLASVALTQDALAEDLEIWASSEFDFVDLGEGYTRASVLMPQKRNPYALSMIRGAAGSITGQVAGFLALQKAPSARSDKLIFAYRDIPPAVDVSTRILRLTRGVVQTLEFNERRMGEALAGGFSQATDLADHLMTACGLDYRTAYRVAGTAVRQVAADGRSLLGITVDDVAAAAVERTGTTVDLDAATLATVIDARRIVASRSATGGAAPEPVRAMVNEVKIAATDLIVAADERAESFGVADARLRAAATAASGR